MGRIRIGVMGCAAIARKSVIPAIKQLADEFTLVAVASRTKEKAEALAAEFGCNAVVGYDALLSAEIDAVYIPLPTGLHDEWINKALAAGKHVYAEKSIANSAPGAHEMVKSARKNDLALMEGYMFQYHPQHQAVKNLISEGAIGAIRSFRGSFGFPPLDSSNFRYDNEVGGGALYDAAGYPLRALHFLLGSHFRVQGASLFNDPVSGTNIFGSAYLKDDSGVGAHLDFGFDHFYQCNYEIWGSKGKLTALRAYTPAAEFAPTLLLEQQGKSETITIAPDNHFIGAMAEFHRLVSGTGDRHSHYDAILLQSDSLEAIKNFAAKA